MTTARHMLVEAIAPCHWPEVTVLVSPLPDMMIKGKIQLFYCILIFMKPLSFYCNIVLLVIMITPLQPVPFWGAVTPLPI